MIFKYPFEPAFKHHAIIAAALAVWVFVFLYFTEPLDVNEFGTQEKLIYLPLYGLFNALCYLMVMPFQHWLFEQKHNQWTVLSELKLMAVLVLATFITSRLVYFYIVMDANPNSYTLDYFASHIFLPAIVTILPIILIGRWSFGKYKEKRLDDQKIEIKGSGNFESLRLQLNDLICIQSSDNYVEITYKEDGSLKKQLIRNKLAEVENSRPELVRTHRSFLINPYHFKQWKTGNRKVNVVLTSDIEVPVSKTFQTAVELAVNSATE